MKSRILPVLSLVLMAGMVLMIGGCGGSGTATSTDKITGPLDVTFTSTCANFPLGGSIHYPPLDFIVTNSTTGSPLQGITMTLFTGSSYSNNGPFWWSDPNETILEQTGGYITATTNNNGVVAVYWSTSDLPASFGTGTYTISGTDFIQAYSGTQSYTFTVGWSLTDCP